MKQHNSVKVKKELNFQNHKISISSHQEIFLQWNQKMFLLSKRKLFLSATHNHWVDSDNWSLFNLESRAPKNSLFLLNTVPECHFLSSE